MDRAKARLSAENKKEIATLPTGDVVAMGSTAPKPRRTPLPHIATQQTPRRSILRKEPAKASDIHARLEALEKHSKELQKNNELLNAALMAVLETNGRLNSAIGDVESARPFMTWEERIARRSAASHAASATSHAASSSNGSALDMYFNTRRESRQAC